MEVQLLKNKSASFELECRCVYCGQLIFAFEDAGQNGQEQVPKMQCLFPNWNGFNLISGFVLFVLWFDNDTILYMAFGVSCINF